MSDEIKSMEELGQLIIQGKVKILEHPEEKELILIEIPEHLPPEPGLGVREIDGKRYYTAVAYVASKDYHEYINDESLPPFRDNHAAYSFIKDTAICQQIGILVRLWKEVSVVHESITSLTHTENAQSFSITWSRRLPKGVKSSDVFVRGFNKGIKYPNVATSGLRDFEHMRVVDKPAADPKGAAGARAAGARHNPLTERDGYGVFTRSICEVLMVAVHGALLRKAHRDVIGRAIKAGLIELLKENRCDQQKFSSKWDNENLGVVVDDLQAAIVADQLRMARFVRAAELFVLELEGWL